MAASGTLDIFLRSTFGVEPGSHVGRELRDLSNEIALKKGKTAPLDHSINLTVYLASGATKLVAHAKGGREQIVAFHFGGDIISVPADAMHASSLVALKDSLLIVFPSREFYDRGASEPAILRPLLDRAQTALHRCRDKAVGLGRKNARERVASFLLSMAERMESVEEEALVLDLPMSRRDIADSLGLTIETVSRQFGELRDAGLVLTGGRSRVRLCDPAALADMAGHF
ncbi:helix-turn-helix domain-containing protein [Altererythrobacter sp.]|uniref:helix-turn-helix domain-containing protein n=1 Tax=Altererythrobacter sp. TaxID=1872480 RepID=UPI003D03C68D